MHVFFNLIFNLIFLEINLYCILRIVKEKKKRGLRFREFKEHSKTF